MMYVSLIRITVKLRRNSPLHLSLSSKLMIVSFYLNHSGVGDMIDPGCFSGKLGLDTLSVILGEPREAGLHGVDRSIYFPLSS